MNAPTETTVDLGSHAIPELAGWSAVIAPTDHPSLLPGSLGYYVTLYHGLERKAGTTVTEGGWALHIAIGRMVRARLGSDVRDRLLDAMAANLAERSMTAPPAADLNAPRHPDR